MKKRLRVLWLIFTIPLHVVTYADNLVFDYKYVKVGVISNDWDNQLGNNPNIRYLGTTDDPESCGKMALDRLLCRDMQGGLHIEELWETALNNTVLEEEEIAEIDASAEKNDVLKKDISRQLLKNNYVVILKKEWRHGLIFPWTSLRYIWEVYHIEITDEIINQAFNSWSNINDYDKIKVNVKFVANGKCKPENLIFSIAKKVPAFAVRGTISSLHPTTARINKQQGVRKMDVVNIYGVYENSKGDQISRRKGVTRVTISGDSTSQLFSIAGLTPSQRNGDIAVLYGRQRSSVMLLGQASLGSDPRYGGRFLYDYMLFFSKHGVAQYILIGGDYNTFKKEPAGYWWLHTEENKYQNVTPRLSSFDISAGYGIGFNFLNCFEIRPYLLLGWQTKMLSQSGYIYYWDSKADNEKGDWANETWLGCDFLNFNGYVGAQLNITVGYPFQIVAGADYNFETNGLKPRIYECHTRNRLNLYAGFRIIL